MENHLYLLIGLAICEWQGLECWTMQLAGLRRYDCNLIVPRHVKKSYVV